MAAGLRLCFNPYRRGPIACNWHGEVVVNENEKIAREESRCFDHLAKKNAKKEVLGIWANYCSQPEQKGSFMGELV